MAKHLIAFEATCTNTAYAAVTPVKDSGITQDLTGKTVQVPTLNQIVALYCYGTHTIQYQVNSPNLRNDGVLPEIFAVDQTASHPLDAMQLGDGPIQLFDDSPIPMKQGENFEVDNITDSSSATSTILVWLSDERPATVSGRLLHGVTASSATSLTGFTWGACSLTFDYALPAGTYAVVGMKARSATGIAARLVFPGYPWRMGVIPSVDALNSCRPERFRNGRWGMRGQKGVYDVWGYFDSTSAPQVEWLAVTTDSAEYVELDLVKVS
jgi:hypothetical protein